MRTLARTLADLRPMLSFLTPDALQRVLARVKPADLARGIAGANYCAGDVALWFASGAGPQSACVSALPEGAVTFVVVTGGDGFYDIRERTADRDGILARVLVGSPYRSYEAAVKEARRRANIHGCDYGTDLSND